MTWSSCFVTFSHFIPRVSRSCATRGLYLPDASTLATTFVQEQVLQTLREHIVIAFKTWNNECRRIRKLMTTFHNGQGSFQILLVASHHSVSNTG